MDNRVFDTRFVLELREILLSTSTAEIYSSSGAASRVTREPFLGEWRLLALEFDNQLGPGRVIFRLCSDGKEVTATIDAHDFGSVLGRRSRSRRWNNSRYHDAAVLVSVLIQEQILTISPQDFQDSEVSIRLPQDRPPDGIV